MDSLHLQNKVDALNIGVTVGTTQNVEKLFEDIDVVG